MAGGEEQELGKQELDLTQKVPEGPKRRKRSKKFKFWAYLHTSPTKIQISGQNRPILQHLLGFTTKGFI